MTEPEFLALWHRLAPYLAVIARKLARPLHLDADDLLSAAAADLWRQRHKLARENPEGLAVTVGKYAMLRVRDAEFRHRRRTVHPVLPDGTDPLDLIAGKEPEPAVDGFLELMDLAAPGDRELFERVFRDGLSLARLAGQSGVTSQAVGGRLNRALDRLLDRLA